MNRRYLGRLGWTLIALTVALALLASPAFAFQRLVISTGYLNVGPIPGERTHYVRIGQSGGFDLFGAVRYEGQHWYAEFVGMITTTSVWSIEDAAGTRFEISNRFRFRPRGTKGHVVWTSLTGGYRWRNLHAGGGLVTIAACDHEYFGACPMHAVTFELGASSPRLGPLGADCALQAVAPWGKAFLVLYRAAGQRQGDTHYRWAFPLRCGVALAVGL